MRGTKFVAIGRTRDSTSWAKPRPAAALTRREHQPLGHELPNDPTGSGAEGGAERDFTLALDGAREEETRHVRDRDEQHERARGPHEQERGTHPTHACGAELAKEDAPPVVRLRVLRRERLPVAAATAAARATGTPGRSRATRSPTARLASPTRRRRGRSVARTQSIGAGTESPAA